MGGERGRESGELVGVLSYALTSSSCEQARAIARQYFTSLCLELSFTLGLSALDGDPGRSIQKLETADLAIFLP
jgi:hypothetical protein